MERKHKHLEFIQLTITRMAANSFLLKGWSVTLIAAIAAIASKDANFNFICIALLPSLAFWFLDAYYLRQERLFRKLYDRVAKVKEDEDIDYSLKTDVVEKEVESFGKVFFSDTITIFHGIIFLLILFLMYLAMSGHIPKEP